MTKGSPVGVQQPLGTNLTYCWKFKPDSCADHTGAEHPLTKGPRPHSPKVLPTRYIEGHGQTPSSDPQSTCVLFGQTPTNTCTPGGECRVGPVFHDLDGTRTVPPKAEIQRSAVYC